MKHGPTLLPTVNIRWGYENPITGELSGNEYDLRQMCDYGAKKVAEGYANFLAISCMYFERDFVKKYMEEAHPSVKYAFGTGEQILRLAMSEYSKELEKAMEQKS
jgi:hypothetical protein